MKQVIKTVYLDEEKLFIIDQRLLPLEEKTIELSSETDVYEAIKTLAVRGAPAIGIAAGYGAYISLRRYKDRMEYSGFKKKGVEILEYIGKSRPTAYNLFYVLGRLRAILDKCSQNGELLDRWKKEALLIHEEDLDKSLGMARAGNPVVPHNAKILTHCNTGGLATGGNGTALSVIFEAEKTGKNILVYVDETRPLLQGSRLTAWELKKTGIPYKIICDNMAAAVMAKKGIDLVLVGADRIAANGDFANKIGTYSLAVLARHHGVPFYCAAPATTFDTSLGNGDSIPIEERDGLEVLNFRGSVSAPPGSDVFNPAFDVTPHSLVTGIITEFGVIYPPFGENIHSIVKG